MVDTVPEHVKAACDALIAAYTGDFLEDLIRDYPDEFEPWASSWARKPYTLYRDYYLQALWYAAEYEWRVGQGFADERLDQEGEARRRRQREHWGRAAQLYRLYAMHACNNRFDTKVTFGTNGREHGERVVMSERALRRCVALYGATGSTHVVDEVYSAYCKHMRFISSKDTGGEVSFYARISNEVTLRMSSVLDFATSISKVWEPSRDTLADVRSAKEQTNAYRFMTRFAPHELPPDQAGIHDRV